MPKNEGGLGIKDLISWNTSAILFQLWRIINNVTSLWITWVRTELLRNKLFGTMKVPSKCSWCFKNIPGVRDMALQHVQYEVRQTISLYFSHDPWLNKKPLVEQFSSVALIRPTGNSQPWEHVVWHTFSVPKYSFLLWLVLKQRLLTRDRMQRFGMRVPAGDCLLCNSDLESHDHLYSSCPFSSRMFWESPCIISLD